MGTVYYWDAVAATAGRCYSALSYSTIWIRLFYARRAAARSMTQNFFQTFILLLLLTFIFFCRHFLSALQLSEVSLRIGGSVILLLIAVRMIFPHPDGVLGRTEGGEPFIVPLAIPALAGPSALATVLLFSRESTGEILVHVAALAAVGVVWLAVFLGAERLQNALGPQVMTAFERLMGLILTAMSIEMLLGGIREFVKSL